MWERKRNTEENQIEKEFDIFETEDVELLYEKLKDDGNIIERMELAYQLKLKEKLFKERNNANKYRTTKRGFIRNWKRIQGILFGL